MGNWQDEQLKDQLQYYSTAQMENIGQVQIFKSCKFPKCYIVKIQCSLKNPQQFQLFSKIENQQNIYLLSLYGYQFGKNCKCESRQMVNFSVTSYWDYYQYSLEALIMIRKKIQIWHIAKACLNGYQAFIRNGIYYDFMTQNLKITEDGRIRINWMHILPQNNHLNFYRFFQQKNNGYQTNFEQFYSPEELIAINQKQPSHKINRQKSNIFSLGMVLLYCATLHNPKYRFYKKDIDYNLINATMHYQLEKRYSKNMLFMIGSMLHYDPDQRMTFQKVLNQYGRYMKGQNHILICSKFSIVNKKISFNFMKQSTVKQVKQIKDYKSK